MASDRYETKVRAERIALRYFTRRQSFLRWRGPLSLAAALAVVAWLVVHAGLDGRRLFTSGPVATAHAMFGTRCNECHGATRIASAGLASGAALFTSVSDRRCSRCHTGPTHHSNQALAPACATCHIEHKGPRRLSDLGDRVCTRCHARLATLGSQAHEDGILEDPPGFAIHVAGFASDHPEFAVDVVLPYERRTRARLGDTTLLRDTAQIKLNHDKHLKPGLPGVDDVRARTGPMGIVEGNDPSKPALNCTYCHRLDERRVSIKPISFTEHCADCHRGDLASKKVLGVTTPHAAPPIVHACLRTALAGATEPEPASAAAKPEECGRMGPSTAPAAPEASAEESAPPQPRGAKKASLAAPTVEEQLAGVEKEIFGAGGCRKCHTLSQPASGLPEVAPTAIPMRWLPRSVFDHGVHRTWSCAECHGRARTSTETADVLLPSISTCRTCHRASGGARTACVECHRYHDKTLERDPNGPRTTARPVRGVDRESPKRGDMGQPPPAVDRR